MIQYEDGEYSYIFLCVNVCSTSLRYLSRAAVAEEYTLLHFYILHSWIFLKAIDQFPLNSLPWDLSICLPTLTDNGCIHLFSFSQCDWGTLPDFHTMTKLLLWLHKGQGLPELRSDPMAVDERGPPRALPAVSLLWNVRWVAQNAFSQGCTLKHKQLSMAHFLWICKKGLWVHFHHQTGRANKCMLLLCH